ncbi:DUF1254 domain-containing protein [Viridibacillus arvi]|nr:DUF1254 domain-containing protein [Viridibacillus arvi]
MYTPQFNDMWIHLLGEYKGQIVNSEKIINDFAMDAYVYGFPLVLMDLTKRKGGVSLARKNRFYHQKVLSTPQFTEVVRPNVDTLYSSAWLDLRDGPFLLHVPNTKNRYYLLPMLDAYSNVFASIGARTTGTTEQQFAIVGPNWRGKLPSNIPVIYSPTNTVWITGRTQTNGPQDYQAVHAIQDKYSLKRIYELNDNYASASSSDHLIITKESPKELITTMDAPAFFQLMMELMYKNPPYPAIQSYEMTAKLCTLGLIPNENFNFYTLHPAVQWALINAARNGPFYIQSAGEQILNNNKNNGWSTLLNDMGNYGTNYQQRAAVALTLFGANVPQDSIYAYNFGDNYNVPLAGQYNYRIHFDAENLPPVNAFWSVTLYNSAGLLVENQLKRYAISPHLDPLKYNMDGSLDLFIQHVSPGKESESNWLPAPLESFNLLLRMYWPQLSVLNSEWRPPTVTRIQK